jgi:glycosyltransferase involved in cell wall biosynthesis
MKILHTVESYSPSVGGMQEVVKQLSERLVKLGHEVTVATRKQSDRQSLELNGVKIKEFDIAGGMVQGYKGDTSPYEEFLQTPEFDILTNFAAQQWATDVALPILDKIPAKKVFVPTGFSALNNPDFTQYFNQMPEWMNKYDMNIFLSDDYRDINFARNHQVKKTCLIPNGAGLDEFSRKDMPNIRKKFNIPEDHFLILHVGSHTGIKGHREAIQIFSKANIQNATFLLIGNNHSQICTYRCNHSAWFSRYNPNFHKKNKRLIIADLPRSETVAAYLTADLFLFPSNIECSPIVLFECMASKTPFLSTEAGNAKEIVTWSNAGEILPTIFEKNDYGLCRADIFPSIKMLENLYRDQPRRQKMQCEGYKNFKERFSWEKITRQYEKLYLDLLIK